MTDLIDSLKKMMRSEAMKIDDMLPSTVVDYDEANNRATIQPLVMMMAQDGEKVSRAQVFDVPVFRFGGGGFFIRYPIKAGDFGWLKANDRDISLILQNGGVQEDMPNTERLHSFSDALFIPDALKGWAVAGKNKDAMVIQSLSGDVVIALHDDKIVIDTPETEHNSPIITVNAETVSVSATSATVTASDVTVTAETTNNGNVTINGNLSVTGTALIGGLLTFAGGMAGSGGSGASVAGNITVTSGDVVVDGISVKGHTHPYTWTTGAGSDNTGVAE